MFLGLISNILISFFSQDHSLPAQPGVQLRSMSEGVQVLKNFKRHNQEKQQKFKRFQCSVCAYKTNRSHDLERHKQSKHESETVVSSLLENLITSKEMPVPEVTISLLEDDGCEEDVDEVGEDEGDEVAL